MADEVEDTQEHKRLEAARLRSEIERNEAERDSLRANQRHWWPPYALGIAVAASIVAAFAGFFVNLYQIAVTDREALKRSNEKLIAENTSLTDRVKKLSQTENDASVLAKRLDDAANASVAHEQRVSQLRALLNEVAPQVRARAEELAKTYSPSSFNDQTLRNAVIITWWGAKPGDAIAVSLNPPSRKTNDEQFAEGVQLGQAQSNLGLRGGGEWVARWVLKSGRIVMTETYPRPFEGITVEIDVTRGKVNGRWPATRIRGNTSERGFAEIVFPSTTPP